MIKVAEPTVKLAALAAPNFTADAPVNPVPAIATDVPPAAGPDVGAIDVTAAAAADEPFIKHLFKTSRAGDFAAAGLPDSVLDILLHQQFHAQAAGYAAQYPHAVSLIVLHGDARAGRLLLQTYERRWHMIDIVLLPSLRGQGLGTDIIETTAHAARRDGAAELPYRYCSTMPGPAGSMGASASPRPETVFTSR